MPSHEITVIRKIDTGHRIVGHGGKCRFLHGHTYTVLVKLEGNLNHLGMVADFGDVKEIIDRWDHRLVLWEEDQIIQLGNQFNQESEMGIVRVPFNPTAENMAQYLAKTFAEELRVHAKVEVAETDSTTATYYARRR